ncbi:hypothetical protein COV04_01230 [Candidatus Uhrbacteria bacterium CG10_big_fil_rev_8_21_14_0_10_48_11]|uniref:DUF2680 domain-containing protein n=1 Tax=Candidatus Uhrbacteria bacterium CG10_big_fil_rev_8_21_14_0_10_48_11 TaxID=1975037 RepID=A0A2M8LFC4_9BACT|nr:MAG: hypothetical protein COV04_01230 [Candidatus Uhrbacteria bacterium CG10_big_fil_rev_8_21_14_0_10_48_11]
MKKKYIGYALLPFLGVGLLGITAASAHGSFGGFGFGVSALSPDEVATRQEARFEAEANLLGVSVDVIKDGWSQGKTLQDIATAQGISADELKTKMETAAENQQKTNLQALVDKGVITQAQADQWLKLMQDRVANSPQDGSGRPGRGMHRGGGFFPL